MLRQSDERQEAVAAAPQPCLKPAAGGEALHGHGTIEDLVRKTLAQQDSIAGDEPAALSQGPVIGDEGSPRDAVAIGEQQILAARGCDCPVAERCGAKAAGFLPEL